MGLLWEQETDQQKWYNTEFLDSLPNPYEEGAKRAEAEALTNKKRKSYVDMKPDRWASKVIIDVCPGRLLSSDVRFLLLIIHNPCSSRS
jgi:hypothetical protein